VNTVTATLTDGRTVEFLPDMIGEGGMKRVYFTADKKSVVCFFKDQAATARDPNRMARLEAILGKFNPTSHPATGKWFIDLFCWPTGIIVKPEFGVMTPAYSDHFFFSAGNFKGKEKCGRWFSSPKLRKMLHPNDTGNWLGYLQLCKRMARAIRKMHMTGLAHSDLSCNNVLLDPSRGTCVVIDIDSLVVPGVYPPDVLGTPGYIAPEVLGTNRLPVNDPNRKLPSNLTDLHALPVLFYEYLLRRHPLKGPKINSTTSTEEDEFLSMGSKALFIENPHDTSNHWSNNQKDWPELKPIYDILGPHLKELFYKAFVEGLHNPRLRPTASAWERALYLSEDMLIPCGNKSCPEKWFIYVEGRPHQCPWCGWKLSNPIPILDFHYAPRKGQFRAEGHSLVCWDKRQLYKWHVFTNEKPVEGADTEPQARVQYYKGQWILWNYKLDSMVSPAGNPVPKDQATYLRDGDEIILSKDEKGRLVSVRMVS
jgi:serine/threonine protein kinase